MNGLDPITLILATCLVVLLGVATLVGHTLLWQRVSGLDPAVLRNFNDRLRSWWLISSCVVATFLLPRFVTILLFAGLSFSAFREYITVAPTRRADHRALFWAFFLFTPLQYLLVWLEQPAIYRVLIPVYACLFIPARMAMANDPRRFLERAAVVQTGLTVCVYSLSFVPALLSLRIEAKPAAASAVNGVLQPESPALVQTLDLTPNYRLLIFLLTTVITAEVSQFVVSKLFRGVALADNISPGRTYEGFMAGLAITTLIGAALANVTPFQIWQAAGLALCVAICAYAGGLTMSAIKRDKRVPDYGTLVEGHGGVLDRIDCLCFAGPVFFHLTQWLLIR